METKTAKINISKVECYLSTACLVCGEGVRLTTEEEYAMRSGFHVNPKICDKCKEAILHIRKSIENSN